MQTKNTAKVNMLAIVRPYAQLISNNAGVSPTAKVNIGVNPRTTVPAPIVTPTSFPVLGLRGGTPLQLTLTYADTPHQTERQSRTERCNYRSSRNERHADHRSRRDHILWRSDQEPVCA